MKEEKEGEKVGSEGRKEAGKGGGKKKGKEGKGWKEGEKKKNGKKKNHQTFKIMDDNKKQKLYSPLPIIMNNKNI